MFYNIDKNIAVEPRIAFGDLKKDISEQTKSSKKQRCHSPLLSLLSDMKNEISDCKVEKKDEKTEPEQENPLLTFQASWMDNNLFEELEAMEGHSLGIDPLRRRQPPPLMSFDSVASDGGEAER